MVNEQIIIETVKRMLDSGIDDSTVISTLNDIGLSNEEANSIIEKVKSVSTTTPVEEKVVSQNDSPQEYSSSREEMNQNEIEAQAQKDELNDTTTYNMLNMHEQKIDEVSSKIDEVRQVVSSSKPVMDASIATRLTELETKVDDISAQTKAVLDVVKNILETDRKILTELEAKK
jgi:hypothetical protein